MNKLKTAATLLLLPAYSVISIASPAIGVATGFQELTIDKAHVRGNATLFEGNSFAAGPEGARMDLSGGTSVRLASSSKGVVYRDRLELKSGAGEVRATGTYRIDALSLHVSGAGQSSVARVLIAGNRLRVGALTGNLKVLNGQGLLIANIPEGSATDFTPANPGNSNGAEASGGAPGATNGGAADGTGASGASSGASAGSGAAGSTGGIGSAAGVAAASSHTLLILGVVVAGAGLATGVGVAATSGSSSTLSPTAR